MARPTDHRSEVLGVEPPVDGVRVDIVGGDAFVRVTAEPGHTVSVPGYSDEPWLRIADDGLVEQNRWSAATYLNETRDGDAPVPERAGRDTKPEWVVVATDGRWSWHDHRIHPMGSGEPSTTELADGVRLVQDWVIPMEVDGQRIEVGGRLLALPMVVPVVPVGAALLAGAAALVVGRKRRRVAAAAATLVAGVVASIVGFGEWAVQPPGAGASILVVVLPVLGSIAAVAAVLLVRRGRAGGAAILLAVALLVGWALVRASVLWHPELPTVLPPQLDRTGVAVVLALGAAAGVLATRRPTRPRRAGIAASGP